MTDTPAPVLSGFSFTEAPRWNDGRLWFSDFYRHEVHSAREDGSDLRLEATVTGQPSGLGWLPDGRLLVTSMKDQRILRREHDGTLVTHADLSGHATGHVNDLAVDQQGRAYVGNFGFDLMGGADLTTACLHRVDPDGTVTEVAEDLWFPNGMAITPDGVLLVNETFGNRVTAFDIDADGALTGRRVWAQFGDVPAARDVLSALGQLQVAPDGGCLDADGAFWVADALGGRAVRVAEGGKVLDEVKPGTNVYACALGGSDGRTLFLCLAPDFHEEARKAAREATIASVRVDVPAVRPA